MRSLADEGRSGSAALSFMASRPRRSQHGRQRPVAAEQLDGGQNAAETALERFLKRSCRERGVTRHRRPEAGVADEVLVRGEVRTVVGTQDVAEVLDRNERVCEVGNRQHLDEARRAHRAVAEHQCLESPLTRGGSQDFAVPGRVREAIAPMTAMPAPATIAK